MNHLTALALVFSAFGSGLYGIYRLIRAKYVSYDLNPIQYRLNKQSKINKRYKTFKKRNKKHLSVNKINRIGALSKYNSLNKLNK